MRKRNFPDNITEVQKLTLTRKHYRFLARDLFQMPKLETFLIAL